MNELDHTDDTDPTMGVQHLPYNTYCKITHPLARISGNELDHTDHTDPTDHTIGVQHLPYSTYSKIHTHTLGTNFGPDFIPAMRGRHDEIVAFEIRISSRYVHRRVARRC